MPALKARITHLWRHGDSDRKLTVAVCPPPADKLKCNEYKYNIEDSPFYLGKQTDPVLDEINASIRELSKKDIQIIKTNIQVWGLTNAPPLCPVTSENEHSVKFYAFKADSDGDEFPRSVPITLSKEHFSLSMESILVRSNGIWKPLRHWLVDLPSRGYLFDRDDPRILLRSQRTEWAMNGKTFPLMDLPAEVRRIIFEHVMGSKIYLDTASCRTNVENIQFYVIRTTSHVDYESEDYDAGHILHLPYYMRKEPPHPFNPFGPTDPNNSILQIRGPLGRQIRNEALKAAWEGTWKPFTVLHGFTRVMAAIPPTGWNWISKIELKFSTAAYFEFFGVTCHPHIQVAAEQSKGPLLKQISTLRELRLVFPSPYEPHMMNPWERLQCRGIFSENLDGFTEEAYETMDPRPCWRTVIDWILTFAFPFVKHLPNIYLKGYIKTSLKAEWDHIFATQFRNRDDSSGYDWNAAMAKITFWPGYAVPTCHCPLSCKLSESMDQFDYDDEFDPEMEKAVHSFHEKNRRWPKLFGPEAEDLSVTVPAVEEDNMTVEE